MSHKKLIASSLTICSASASWAIGVTNTHPTYAQETKQLNPLKGKELIVQEALVQYLNPITAVADGNLAAKVETKLLVYEVQGEETLAQVSEWTGVDEHVLARMNPSNHPHQLQAGQKLRLPFTRKWIRVQMGETLESLVEKYETNIALIKHLNPELSESPLLYVGQLIAVPQKQDLPQQAITPKHGTHSAGKAKILPIQRHMKPKPMAISNQSPSLQTLFRWPVIGKITSHFGWRDGRPHRGIDIWNQARANTPIHAAANGIVTRSGYSSSFGNLVVIDHGDGWETYYAHMSRICISKGERIEQGQILGMMGKTGEATGYHLHFEVRKNKEAINPLSVLKR